MESLPGMNVTRALDKGVPRARHGGTSPSTRDPQGTRVQVRTLGRLLVCCNQTFPLL